MAFTMQINAQHGRLFLWVPVCLSIGIGIYFSIRFEPAAGLIQIIGGACVILGLVAVLRWRSGNAVILRVVFLIILGFLLAVFRTHSVAEPVLGWRYYGPIEGTVMGIDRSNSNKPRVILKNVDLGKISKPRTPTYIRVSFHSNVGLQHLIPGAHIRTIGSVSPPSGPVEPGGFDFQMYAWFKRLGAVGYSRKPVELVKPPDLNTYSLKLFDLRMRISDHIRSRIKGQTGTFAAAILTGDRSTIDPDILQDLRDSNLAHLLAISGLHMGLLVGFCFALVRYGFALIPYVALKWPTKKIGAVVAVFAGFAYLQISGAAVATERAFIMVTVMLVGVIMDKPVITLRAVALAATILLVLHPESLSQPGFQMSFAATTALVASFEFLKHQTYWQRLQFGRNRFVQPIIALVISSFIAGAATAPFAAYHFNQIAQYGLLANLSSVPVMGMLVMPAAVLAGVLSVIGLDAIPFWIMGVGIDWILGSAHWVAGLNGSVMAVPQGQVGVLPLIGFGAVFFILWKGYLRWVGVGICCFAFTLWTQTERPVVLISDTGRLLGILHNGERALNRSKGSGFAASVWLENDGDRKGQEIAAFRSDGFSDVMKINLYNKEIGYVWPKSTPITDIENICSQVDILIAPNLKDKLSAGCFQITKPYLRYQGAVALTLSGQSIHIKTARQVTGERLWNTWWLRKRADKS
ncbi:ComEC family competence protein [Amylibacter sp. SFDW26]|uniref:ComEC/Rec2 family competence protein n=1 Tax=Amylibacter sp. SFDW26 TaxID=2652722 RepID=UPI0012614BA6|nr:ComEC/Rec2 family competence protein [Amylibacter sp. SFDW26]KAB7615680.1 ComEC family competence protein [Amylibacter sp. SFDW26]